jgi:hypothetical protein
MPETQKNALHGVEIEHAERLLRGQGAGLLDLRRGEKALMLFSTNRPMGANIWASSRLNNTAMRDW